mmetsp:Transcript_38778/g.119671  ORF Transcript_38778/g.119671 Transcript_38778/m.119671 type:complete len:322 (+) Transcript_38778:2181-3146(+)
MMTMRPGASSRLPPGVTARAACGQPCSGWASTSRVAGSKSLVEPSAICVLHRPVAGWNIMSTPSSPSKSGRSSRPTTRTRAPGTRPATPVGGPALERAVTCSSGPLAWTWSSWPARRPAEPVCWLGTRAETETAAVGRNPGTSGVMAWPGVFAAWEMSSRLKALKSFLEPSGIIFTLHLNAAGSKDATTPSRPFSSGWCCRPRTRTVSPGAKAPAPVGGPTVVVPCCKVSECSSLCSKSSGSSLRPPGCNPCSGSDAHWLTPTGAAVAAAETRGVMLPLIGNVATRAEDAEATAVGRRLLAFRDLPNPSAIFTLHRFSAVS